MEKIFNRYSSFGPSIIRIGLAFVYLWFGFQLVSDPAGWSRQVPEWVMVISPFSIETVVLINGIFEIVVGLALLVGFWTRLSALLLALHLIPIIINLGYGPTGVRDFGIFMATLGLSFLLPDRLTVDKKRS